MTDIKTMKTAWVVAVGDPFNGLRLYGPFRVIEDAVNYMEHELRNERDAMVVRLESVNITDFDPLVEELESQQARRCADDLRGKT